MPPPVAHILVVEDDIDHTTLIMRALEEHGITDSIARVGDGEAAIDYLEQRNAYADPQSATRPHLVLLDLNLPKYSGLEVLRYIKTSSHLNTIPVVILTTSDAETDRLRAYDEHANAYVTKPVDFDRFSAMIRDLGQFWAVWNVTQRITP
ncbi:MAG: response regulator [Phycisphaerales bacterium]|nr:response regulator [Phycisphaerales bacterium]